MVRDENGVMDVMDRDIIFCVKVEVWLCILY